MRLSAERSRSQDGFTLIELLVVMIIIGVLAAIAVPAFLNQKKKARETAVKSDVKTIAKEVVGYYIDGTGALTLSAGATEGTWQLLNGSSVVADGRLSTGNSVSARAAITGYDNYCVAVVSGQAGARPWHADSTGLVSGDCP